MTDIAIKINNLSKYYKLYAQPKDRLLESLHPFGKTLHRKFFSLNNIHLEVKKGELLGVVGRNGAGKSTLLKIISRVIQPSSGEVRVHGKVNALLELNTGLNPDFTGLQNIHFSGLMMGYSHSEMNERAEAIVDFAGIGEYIHQPLRTYSSGMKARLAFALASHIEPDILILDEILSVGDDLFRRKCYSKMEEFFHSGCTILFVSHNLSSVNYLCSRAILMDRGEIILDGPPKLVTTYYQKYLFHNPKESEKTRNEIIQLNQDYRRKAEFISNMPQAGTDHPADSGADDQLTFTEAYFIPGLVPKSTVVTRNYDVDIEDVHIRTLDGRLVNVLMMKGEYIFSFKIRFHLDAVQVGVGAPIRTEKGLVLTNYTLFGEFIEEVKNGSLITVDCRFTCIFLPGTYYVTAETGAVMNGERVVLNRVVDALAFKVETDDKKTAWGGFVYCNQRLEIKIE